MADGKRVAKIELDEQQVREVAAALGVKNYERIPSTLEFQAVDDAQVTISHRGGGGSTSVHVDKRSVISRGRLVVSIIA